MPQDSAEGPERLVFAEHIPIGEGSIDWKEFFRTLQEMGYSGYLGLDLGLTDKLIEGYCRSVDRLLAIADELKLTLQL